MSERIGNIIIIEPESDLVCSMCGKEDETRPYGKGGERICFSCAETIPEITDHNMGILLFGKEGELW